MTPNAAAAFDHHFEGRLLFEPWVMVTSVPWQLHSSAHRDLTGVEHVAGEIRRGIDRSAAS
jgi:hypothetical protein